MSYEAAVVLAITAVVLAGIWSFTVIVLRLSNKQANDPYEPRDRDQ